MPEVDAKQTAGMERFSQGRRHFSLLLLQTSTHVEGGRERGREREGGGGMGGVNKYIDHVYFDNSCSTVTYFKEMKQCVSNGSEAQTSVACDASARTWSAHGRKTTDGDAIKGPVVTCGVHVMGLFAPPGGQKKNKKTSTGLLARGRLEHTSIGFGISVASGGGTSLHSSHVRSR